MGRLAMIGAAAWLAAGAVAAQDASAPRAATAAAETPSPSRQDGWQTFSQSGSSTFLVNLAGADRVGDEREVTVARVPRSGSNYTHALDRFEIRCGARETRLASSTDVYEDGEAGDSFPSDEPWTPVERGAFDDILREMVCEDASPRGRAFADIKAFIDAGRPFE